MSRVGNRSSACQPSDELDPTDGLLASAARVVLTFSGDGGRGLIEEHTRDDSGHCRACYSSAAVSSRWPCMLWTIARHAQSLAPHRRPGGSS